MPHTRAVRTIGRYTETMDKTIVQAHWQSALHDYQYAHVNRRVPRSAEHIAIFWVYRDRAADESRGYFRGLIVMVLPEGREAVGASGGPGTAVPTQVSLRRHHPYCYALRTGALANTANSTVSH